MSGRTLIIFFKLEEMFNVYPREVINIRDENRSTLLIIAAKIGNSTIVKILLEKEIDVNAQDVTKIIIEKYNLFHWID